MRPFDHAQRRALAAGASSAWDEICREVAPRVELLVRLRLDRRLRGRIAVEDVVQDVLFQLSRSRVDPGPDGAALLAWVRRAVEHQIVDQHRRHVEAGRRSLDCERGTADALASAASEATSPTRAARRHERLLALYDALERMPRAQRDVLVHRLLEGLSLAQTASCMERSEGAIAVLQHRALRKLRRLYAGAEPTGAV